MEIVDGSIVKGSATELAVVQKDAPCSARMLVTSRILVTSIRSDGIVDGMGSYSVAARRIVDRGMSGTICDPGKALGGTGVEMMSIETGMDASRSMVARFIKGSDTLETSSRTPDGTDTGRMISRCKVTSRI